MFKKVSVIIPTYNYGQFISYALESVLKQKYPDLEIIVIDDGSTDNTKKALEKYHGKIKYIYQQNSGLSAARNAGIKHATGEFILFLDADDLLGDNLIREQVGYMTKHPHIKVSVCRNRLFKKMDKKGSPKTSGSWPLFKENLDIHLCYLNIAPPHAFFFRTKIIKNSRGFDTKLKACEDYDLWIRLASKGNPPYYNPKGLVYYRRHPESMSSNLENQYLHDLILHKRVAKILEDSNFPVNRKFEGFLALSSGILRTAFLLRKYGVPIEPDFLQLANNCLRKADQNYNKKILDVFFFLSFFRSRAILIHYAFKAIPYTKIILKSLNETVKYKKDQKFNCRYLVKSIIRIATTPKKNLLEKTAICFYVLLYLKNVFVSWIKKQSI